MFEFFDKFYRNYTWRQERPEQDVAQREDKPIVRQAGLENQKQDLNSQEKSIEQDREMLQSEYLDLKATRVEAAKAEQARCELLLSFVMGLLFHSK